eukprot:jgi/Chlat1/9028/Chrsp94S00703
MALRLALRRAGLAAGLISSEPAVAAATTVGIGFVARRGAATESTAVTQSPSLDWDVLFKNITSEAGRRELHALRKTFEQQHATIEPERIDWESFKKELDPKLVAVFQQAYESINLPSLTQDPEFKSSIDRVREAFENMEKEAEAITQAAKQRISELENELKTTLEEKEMLASASVDDILAREPDTAKQIDREIEEGNWRP